MIVRERVDRSVVDTNIGVPVAVARSAVVGADLVAHAERLVIVQGETTGALTPVGVARGVTLTRVGSRTHVTRLRVAIAVTPGV